MEEAKDEYTAENILVYLFTNTNMKEHGDSKDILGRAYEYCLSLSTSTEGKNAGEFYTPSSSRNFRLWRRASLRQRTNQLKM